MACDGLNLEQGRSFRIPDDLEALNCIPIPFWVVDLSPDNPHTIWANNEGLACWGRETIEDFRQMKMNERSEVIRRMHDDFHDKVVRQGQTVGPLRRTFHPRNISRVVDHFLAPLDAICPGESEPRTVILNYCNYVPEESFNDKVNCSHEMLNRVCAHTLLFLREGNYVHANQEARRHYERIYGKTDLTLHALLESFTWENQEQLLETLHKIQELSVGDGAVVFERAVKHAAGFEGGEEWYKMQCIATNCPSSGKPAVLVTGLDITEQRNAVADLLNMNQQQEQFFAEMAHELRTPLHCITGLAESMLGDIKRCPPWKRNLSLIRAEGMRLAALVSDIVDGASNKRKTLLIKHEKVALHQVVERACVTVGALVKKNVKIINHVPSDLPKIQADSQRLIQILVNLMSNSIRFTSKGHVKVKGRLLGKEVELQVSDTGIGIPEEKLPSIFGAFEMVGGDTTRKYGGSGLGLALVKTLVEAHHGTVSVTSKQDGKESGTKFTILLPLVQPMPRRSASSVPSSSPSAADLERVASHLDRSASLLSLGGLERNASGLDRLLSSHRKQSAAGSSSEDDFDDEVNLISKFVSAKFGTSFKSYNDSFISRASRRESILSLGLEVIEKERAELHDKISFLEDRIRGLEKQLEGAGKADAREAAREHTGDFEVVPERGRNEPFQEPCAKTDCSTTERREPSRVCVSTQTSTPQEEQRHPNNNIGDLDQRDIQQRVLTRLLQVETLAREAAENRERLSQSFRHRQEVQMHSFLRTLTMERS